MKKLEQLELQVVVGGWDRDFGDCASSNGINRAFEQGLKMTQHACSDLKCSGPSSGKKYYYWKSDIAPVNNPERFYIHECY